ncbi:MAG: hypothetical protein II324_01070, partial [Selenomonadales bacterium]|nr:hypothetical protein [Selenomonadales bacterium]
KFPFDKKIKELLDVISDGSFLLHDKIYSFNGDGSGHCSLDIQYNNAFCGIFHWALVCSSILLLRLFAGGSTIRCSSHWKLSRDIF